MSRTSQIYGHMGVIFGLGGGDWVGCVCVWDWQLRIMKVAEKKEEDTEKTKTRNLETYIWWHDKRFEVNWPPEPTLVLRWISKFFLFGALPSDTLKIKHTKNLKEIPSKQYYQIPRVYGKFNKIFCEKRLRKIIFFSELLEAKNFWKIPTKFWTAKIFCGVTKLPKL